MMFHIENDIILLRFFTTSPNVQAMVDVSLSLQSFLWHLRL